MRKIAVEYPADASSMRTWTLWMGLKEYLLDNLRNATEAERRAAKAWVRSQTAKRTGESSGYRRGREPLAAIEGRGGEGG